LPPSSSFLAQTITIEFSNVEFPIQRFLPLRRYPPGTFLAEVFRLVASLPDSGSVRANPRIFLKVKASGMNLSLCSSLPSKSIVYIPRQLWAIMNVPIEVSILPISYPQAPIVWRDSPGPPKSVRWNPFRPSLARSSLIS
jgi:hypothetical protein